MPCPRRAPFSTSVRAGGRTGSSSGSSPPPHSGAPQASARNGGRQVYLSPSTSAGYGWCMRSYAALLRGIAPSGTNMTNDKLRGVFERLGFSEVASVLASGNIVFRSELTDVPLVERRIEASLTADLGLSSRTIVRDHRELRDL